MSNGKPGVLIMGERHLDELAKVTASMFFSGVKKNEQKSTQ